MSGPINALRQLWFASRKMRLSVPRGALVLEVGSGDSPCPRSDVLFDLTLENHERVGGRTVADRPMVLGIAERLPFVDGAFDFIIAFHMLHHASNPAAVLGEFARVARAGYIETAAPWVERVHPLTMSRSEIGVEFSPDGPRLLIRHKSAPLPDQDMFEHFNRAAAIDHWFERIPRDAVVTRFAWEGRIPHRVVNPGALPDWPSPAETTRADQVDPRPPLRRWLKAVAQRTHRPRAVDLVRLLRCTACAAPLAGGLSDAELVCSGCRQRYAVKDGIPHMHPAAWRLR